MQILSVDLENVKSYERATVEFTHGVNAIVGHNGAGKSTILEAIGFAVFDSLDYRHIDFVRSGAKTAVATVTILSNMDERAYQVVRRIGSSNQHYILDPEIGARICEGKADVLSFLREHLGVDSSADLSALFRDAVGVAQGTFTAAFLATPAQRKTIFDSLLQVEEYQKAYERLREPLRLLSLRKQEVEVEAAGMQARLERLPELEAALEQDRQETASVQKRLGKTDRELEQIVGQREAMESRRERLIALQNRQSQTAQRLKSVEVQLMTAQQARADAEEARQVVAKSMPGYETYEAAQARQKEVDAKVRQRQQLEAKRAASDKALALSESELARLHQELKAIAAAEETVRSLEVGVQEQDRLEERLAAAKQQQLLLQEYQVQVKRQGEQLGQQEARHNALITAQARTEQLERERTTLQRQIEELRNVLDQNRDAEARFRVEGTELKERTEMLGDAEKAMCPVCEQPLLPERRTQLLERNQQRLAALRDDFRQTQDKINEDDLKLQSQEKELTRLLTELRKMPRAEELAQLQQLVESTRQELEATQAQMYELRGIPEQIRTITEQVAASGDLRRRYAVAAEKAGQRVRVETTVQEMTEKQQSREQDLAGLQKQMAQFADLDQQADAVGAELQELQADYQAVLSNQRLANSLEDRVGEVEQYQQGREQVRNELSVLGAELIEVESNFNADTYQQLVVGEQELRSEIGGLGARLNMLVESRKKHETDISTLKQLQRKMEDADTQHKTLADQEETLETIRSLLRQAGPYITSVMIRQISEGARGIYSDIMQDYSRHLAWNDDYGITLEVDGHARQFSQLSGGEQMSAALALRLALLREMSSIDVAFFDEPTANLDENRRESLARQILQIRGFRQLFVISHDDTFEQATQNLIRVERINGISRVQEDG